MQLQIAEIFERLRIDIQDNLAVDTQGAMREGAPKPSLTSTGEKHFDFRTDTNGSYTVTQTQYGGGITLSCTAVMSLPNVVFSLKVTCSDGGGGSWTNVSPGKALTFKLKTSLWHKTTVAIAYRSAVRNAAGAGVLKYSY